jgi:hypothetical protein
MSRQSNTTKRAPRGLRVPEVRRFLRGLPNIAAGRSYGMPSFLLNGEFFARFRDEDTVLVLQLGTIAERDVLVQLDSRSFFFTEHYRNYPVVLIHLAEVSPSLFTEVVREAWRNVSAVRASRPRRKPS